MTALIATLAVLGYFAWAYFHPYRQCSRCKDSGVNALSTRHRSGRCRRCKGDRQVKTIGSRAMYRAVRAVRDRLRTW